MLAAQYDSNHYRKPLQRPSTQRNHWLPSVDLALGPDLLHVLRYPIHFQSSKSLSSAKILVLPLFSNKVQILEDISIIFLNRFEHYCFISPSSEPFQKREQVYPRRWPESLYANLHRIGDSCSMHYDGPSRRPR